MFGRKNRKQPLVRDTSDQLEALRDDCIAIFINSGLTQKQIHERGGPTPQTISKWLYKETHFPRYATIEAFLLALDYGLTIAPLADLAKQHERPLTERLQLQISIAGKVRMPTRKKKARAKA